MMTTELLADIDDLRAELAEARRYVRRAPADARNAVERFVDKFQEIARYHWLLMDRCQRTELNLDWGLQAIAVCPDALIGAIDLASWELAWIKGRIEKEQATMGEGRASDQ